MDDSHPPQSRQTNRSTTPLIPSDPESAERPVSEIPISHRDATITRFADAQFAQES
jgi:hypothetical protein